MKCVGIHLRFVIMLNWAKKVNSFVFQKYLFYNTSNPNFEDGSVQADLS
jgi:hypothetical protein